MKTSKRMLLPLVAVGAMAVSWYFFTGPTLAAPTPTSNALTYNFPVNLPNYVTDVDQNASFKLLFNPDDGRYLFQDVPHGQFTSTLNYTYRPRANPSYRPYVEATEFYDDNVPPPNAYRLANQSTVTDPNQGWMFTSDGSLNGTPNQTFPNQTWVYTLPFSPSTNLSLNSNPDPYKKELGGYPIRIDPVRAIVSGNAVTYVVTFENLQPPNAGSTACSTIDGQIEFRYDPTVLEFLQVKDGNESACWNIPSTTGSITLGYQALTLGEQRSLFFHFRTYDNLATGRMLDPAPTATITVTNPVTSGSCWWDRKELTTAVLSSQNTVDNAYDPNHKSVSPGNFCTNYNGNLTYKIEFQNYGPAPAYTVTISDELDVLFPSANVVSPGVKAYIGNKRVSIPAPVKNGRKITFTIPTGGLLHGKMEPGYGSSILDADTRGHVIFEIPASTLESKPKCNAVCNRARITFDCNPPIETDLAISTISCGTCAPASCDTCAVCQDSVRFSTEVGTLDSVTPPVILDSTTKDFLEANGYDYFKWYPESAVSDVHDLEATVTAAQSTTLTLVASSTDPLNCRRFIYHRRFEVACTMKLFAEANLKSQDCTNGLLYSIDASVTGTGFQQSDLVWSFFVDRDHQKGCVSNTMELHERDVSPGLYYVAVTDTKTGCFVEEWIDRRYKPIAIEDDPTDCVADLIVTGGQSPYSYQWGWDGGSHMGGSTLNLRGKTGVHVTVTDANTCTAVFEPTTGYCPPKGGGMTEGLMYALGGLVAIGIAAFLYWWFIEKKKG